MFSIAWLIRLRDDPFLYLFEKAEYGRTLANKMLPASGHQSVIVAVGPSRPDLTSYQRIAGSSPAAPTIKSISYTAVVQDGRVMSAECPQTIDRRDLSARELAPSRQRHRGGTMSPKSPPTTARLACIR